MLKLEPTSASFTYDMQDGSGYRFAIHAGKDDEFGWSASVTMTSYGMGSAEAAVEHLRYSAASFLEQLNAATEV